MTKKREVEGVELPGDLNIQTSKRGADHARQQLEGRALRMAKMDDQGPCPSCGVSWRGKPIPEESREHFGKATHFSKLIGIELRGVYDGVVINKCPACKSMWHRFTNEAVTEGDIEAGRITRDGVKPATAKPTKGDAE